MHYDDWQNKENDMNFDEFMEFTNHENSKKKAKEELDLANMCVYELNQKIKKYEEEDLLAQMLRNGELEHLKLVRKRMEESFEKAKQEEEISEKNYDAIGYGFFAIEGGGSQIIAAIFAELNKIKGIYHEIKGIFIEHSAWNKQLERAERAIQTEKGRARDSKTARDERAKASERQARASRRYDEYDGKNNAMQHETQQREQQTEPRKRETQQREPAPMGKQQQTERGKSTTMGGEQGPKRKGKKDASRDNILDKQPESSEHVVINEPEESNMDVIRRIMEEQEQRKIQLDDPEDHTIGM